MIVKMKRPGLTVSLGEDVPNGPYTLQVSVSRNDGGRRRARANAWADFEVQ